MVAIFEGETYHAHVEKADQRSECRLFARFGLVVTTKTKCSQAMAEFSRPSICRKADKSTTFAAARLSGGLDASSRQVIGFLVAFPMGRADSVRGECTKCFRHDAFLASPV